MMNQNDVVFLRALAKWSREHRLDMTLLANTLERFADKLEGHLRRDTPHQSSVNDSPCSCAGCKYLQVRTERELYCVHPANAIPTLSGTLYPKRVRLLSPGLRPPQWCKRRGGHE